MQPTPRAVAVCEGGLHQGGRFSVPLADDGQPPEVLELGGGTYERAVQLKLRAGTKAYDATYAGFELHDPKLLETGIVQGHHFVGGAWLYRAQA